MILLNIRATTLTEKIKKVKAFVIIFYAVGIMGLLWPTTHSLFIKLIPTALLLSFAILLLFHGNTFSRKSILVFSSIFILSFIIEAIGVNTGVIFGNYSYGSGLGLKLFKTPIIIGLNWFLLVYTTASVVNLFKLSMAFNILLASVAMVIYDIVMEQMASSLDMWYWLNHLIPTKNYIAWFVLSILFHSMIKLTNVKTENKIASTVLSCQFLFFLILLGINKLSI